MCVRLWQAELSHLQREDTHEGIWATQVSQHLCSFAVIFRVQLPIFPQHVGWVCKCICITRSRHCRHIVDCTSLALFTPVFGRSRSLEQCGICFVLGSFSVITKMRHLFFLPFSVIKDNATFVLLRHSQQFRTLAQQRVQAVHVETPKKLEQGMTYPPSGQQLLSLTCQNAYQIMQSLAHRAVQP